jgi:P-type Cu2+ transporter
MGTDSARPGVRCTHCELPVPADLVDRDGGPSFCCNGCRTVYATLNELGLDGYYGLRRTLGAGSDVKPPTSGTNTFGVFDRESFVERHVHQREDGLCEVEFLLEGVHCAACVWLVERLPRAAKGVVEARLRLSDAVVRLVYDPGAASLSQIARALDGLGYPPHPVQGEERREIEHRADRRRLVRLGVAGACAGNAMLLAFALYAGEQSGMERAYEQFFRWSSLLVGTVCLAWPGRTFLRGAWAAVRTRTGNLDLPIALALVAGGVVGAVHVVRGSGEIYFDSLCVLVFLLLVGRHVQQRQQRWAADAVDLTRALTPLACRARRGDETEFSEVAVDELEVGDVVEVPSGGLVPADGVVLSGRARIDQALLTGESDPVPVDVGSSVHAGTRSDGAPLHVRVEALGANSRIGRLMEVVQRGLAAKPPIVRLTDRIAGWFVVVLSTIGIGCTAYWWAVAGLSTAVERTVALLIVACPCALGLATPLTLAVAVGRAARRGLLVKDAGALERLSHTSTIVLDKTGTLTGGRPEVVAWCGPPELRPMVAALEARSSHPLARALVRAYAQGRVAEAQDVIERHDGGITGAVDGNVVGIGSPRWARGRGFEPDAAIAERALELESSGHTVVVVARDGRVCALAALLDAPRPGALAALDALRASGHRLEILSGDADGPVRRVADLLEVPSEHARGGVDPEGKLARVRELRAGGGQVVMVGDGVNDAAALAAADVGVAVHGGAEASLAAADVYVSRPGLEPLVDLVAIARRTMRTVRLNLGLSLAYNLCLGTLAVTGHVDALVAAIVMPISSATVLGVALLSLSRPLRSGGGGGEAPKSDAEPESRVSPSAADAAAHVGSRSADAPASDEVMTCR